MAPNFRTPPVTITAATVGAIDLTILLAIWCLISAASIRDFGYWPAVIFVILGALAITRNTSNGILLLLLIFYSPAAALTGLPAGPFVIATSMLAVRYFVKDFLMDARGLKMNSVTLLAFLYLLYAAITVIYSPQMELALLYYKKYVEGLAVLILFFATVNTTEELGRVFKWWAMVAALALLVKLAHLYMGSDAALFRLMETLEPDVVPFWDKRVSIWIDGATVNRLLWPGEEPNYSSTSMIFPFMISLALFSVARSWKKIFWILIAAMIGVSAIGTYSRSGFIAIAFVTILYTLHGNMRMKIASFLMAGICFVLLLTIPQLHNHIATIGVEVRGDGSGRYDLWTAAVDMWLDAPFIGNGLASYYRQFGAAHNTFLQIMAELGVIGFTLFCLIIWISVKACLRLSMLYPDKANPDLRFQYPLIIGLIGTTMMINTITYQDIKLFWLNCGACASMLYVYRTMTRRAATLLDQESGWSSRPRYGYNRTDSVET